MININWQVGGTTVNSLDYTTSAAGGNTPAQTVYISHTGNNPITNCKLYIGQIQNGYTGDYTPAADLNEILNWGNSTTISGFGGVEINMDAAGSFPIGNWPTYNSKSSGSYNVFRTNYGDTTTSGILLDTTMNSTPAMTISGTIPPFCSVWPCFRTRVTIPSNEIDAGNRQFELRLSFTYSS